MRNTRFIPALVILLVTSATAFAQKSTPADSVASKGPDIRNAKNAIVTLETTYGKMTLELYHDIAPAHADSFLARCGDGFYDSTLFHRIMKGFMIQGGNAFLVKKENVKYYLPNELNSLPHILGTLSMASKGAPTTAQTQFFICLGRTAQLDNSYVVFGQLVKGFDVLKTIGEVKVQKSSAMRGEMSDPVEDVYLVKAYRSDAEGKALK